MQRGPAPWPLVLAAAALGGLGLGIAGDLIPALIGLGAMCGALALAVPHGLGAVGQAGAVAAIAAAIGFAGAQIREERHQNAPRRDTARDAVFVERGRITAATIERSRTVEHYSERGLDRVEYCGAVRFAARRDDIVAYVRAERCDLTPALWSVLDAIPGQGLDVVYLPDDVVDTATVTLDFRYAMELDYASVSALYARCDDPDDRACQDRGSF